MKEAKVKMKKWSTLVKQAIREGKTGDELDRLSKQQDNAIKAVENAQAALLEEKKLLDNAQQRQLAEKRLAAQNGKPNPFLLAAY